MDMWAGLGPSPEESQFDLIGVTHPGLVWKRLPCCGSPTFSVLALAAIAPIIIAAVARTIMFIIAALEARGRSPLLTDAYCEWKCVCDVGSENLRPPRY